METDSRTGSSHPGPTKQGGRRPFLMRYQIYDYTVEDLEEDLANLRRLTRGSSLPILAR
jgi:hypothetical protein